MTLHTWWRQAHARGWTRMMFQRVVRSEIPSCTLSYVKRWAEILLIDPCSADTLSKIAHGPCDNLVTSLLRALAPATPTFIFPVMNTLVYEHPLTAEHLSFVRDIVQYQVVGPIEKNLACGDIGMTGCHDECRDIVKIMVDRMRLIRKDD
ncbi:flavoprotein, partial [Rhizopogon salebrosus TDB-379]